MKLHAFLCCSFSPEDILEGNVKVTTGKFIPQKGSRALILFFLVNFKSYVEGINFFFNIFIAHFYLLCHLILRSILSQYKSDFHSFFFFPFAPEKQGKKGRRKKEEKMKIFCQYFHAFSILESFK